MTTTVYTAGITPETTLVFKALVVIAVCLLQAPKFRAALSRRRPSRSDTPANQETVAPETISTTESVTPMTGMATK